MTLFFKSLRVSSLSKSFVNVRFHHVCVIGSGPGGLYASQHLIKHGAKVDVYERLPVPFGLVRYGVAPDHPEVKNVVNSFNKVLSHPNCRFIGNITVGKEVNLDQLVKAYDAVLLSYGSSEDRKLKIPGEELMSSAREFVGWYNGLPENSNTKFDLTQTETAFIIGHGNVALDVARILLSPVDKLAKTDIAKHALEELSKSRIKRVVIYGRRGPLQVSFTIKELRELVQTATAMFDPADFVNVNVAELERPKKRLTELMIKTANEQKIPSNFAEKLWELKFFRSPRAITSRNGAIDMEFGINKFEGGKLVTYDAETATCDIAFRSVGYQGKRLFEELPWDESRGVIPNVDGKVSDGVYVTGWVKTGPKGVILNTMTDAFSVASLVLKDLQDKPTKNSNGLLVSIPGKRITSYADYVKILEYEKTHGKVTTVNQMLDIIQ